MVYLFVALLGAAVIAADQWVKYWAVISFAAPFAGMTVTSDPPRAFLPGVAELIRVHNYGAAWSSFAGQKWLLLALTGVIVVAVLVLIARRTVRHPLGLTAGALIVAGGLGNIIDRVRQGYVVDMIHLQFWPDYPVFNVADIAIVCGAILGVIYYLWVYDKYDKPVKKDENHGETDTPAGA